jgi:hypothetical protein
MALSGSDLALGGAFSSLGAAVRNNIAAIDLTTGLLTAFDPNMNGDVDDLAVDNGSLYAVGSFTFAGATGRQ